MDNNSKDNTRAVVEKFISEHATLNIRYKFVEDMPMNSPAYQQLMEDFMYAVCSGSERPCED